MNFSLISAIQSANRAGPVLSCSTIRIYTRPVLWRIVRHWLFARVGECIYEYTYAFDYVDTRYRIHYITVVAVMENIDDFYRGRLWREE